MTLALALAACGGGGSSSGGSPAGDLTLSGTIQAASSLVVDTDTNDPDAPFASNNTVAQAQPLPNPVMVAGFVTRSAVPGQGRFNRSADLDDYYLLDLAPGQTIHMDVADADNGDVDIELYDAALNLVDSSVGTGRIERVTAQNPGRHVLRVLAYSGRSNYSLAVGVQAAMASLPATADTLSLSTDLVPRQVVLQWHDAASIAALAQAADPAGETAGASGNPTIKPTINPTSNPTSKLQVLGMQARRSLLQSLGLSVQAGDTDRPVLLQTDASPLRARGAAPLSGSAASSDPIPAEAETEAITIPALADGARIDPMLADRRDTLYQIKHLRRQAGVRSADPNFRLRSQRVPNDPLLPLQWHYAMINLQQAWDISTGTPATGQVVVAVIDTGVRLTHPDLSSQLLRAGGQVVGYDFVSNPADALDGNGIDPDANDPGDQAGAVSSSWHGTHVAGTLAAASNNGAGVAGVSWGARIMPVRVLGRGGSGTSYDVIQGIRYAAGLSNDSGRVPSQRADVINLSLGCLNCFSAAEQALYDAVRAAGVFVVAAAGNERTSAPSYPAAYRGVISVGAVTLTRSRAPYSNFGATIDLVAPGGDTGNDLNADGYSDGVLSTQLNQSGAPDYRFQQGTSMAAPHVGGVIALMRAVHPGLTPDDVDSLLARGELTTDLGAAGRDDQFGHGLIDAARAVQAARNAASGIVPTVITAQPARVDLGSAASTASIQLVRTGSASLNITGASSDQSWLTVSTVRANPAGLGPYDLSVNRTGLPPGSYSASLRFSLSDSTTLTVPVTLLVTGSLSNANTGRYYVLLLNAAGDVVQQREVNGSNGRYDFRFSGIAPGRYSILAGTDSNWDDLICDEGEVCGEYPTLGTPTVLDIDASRSGLDFGAGLVSRPGVASAGVGKAAGVKGLGRSP